MVRVLYSVFFLSGASALLFETLWFRLAGLAFGNSVWASSIVLAAFMGGLAIGNGVAARMGDRLSRPVRAYAWLELLIGGIGIALVLLFPILNAPMAGILRPILEQPLALNLVRLAGAFFLMLLPAAAMGATLPVMVRGLRVSRRSFARRLGVLYGCNTLGAVVGALAGEMWLVHWVGVRGTGLIALGCNLLAATIAWRLSRAVDGERAQAEESPEAREMLTHRAMGLLAAAFLSGGILLALEVVWFRFMLLFTFGTSLVFSVMLAVVLAGIGIGGWLGGLGSGGASRRDRGAGAPAAIAAASGALVMGTLFVYVSPRVGLDIGYFRDDHGWVTWWRAMGLMFPVSLLSGALFTRLGRALHDEISSEIRATGLLALFNTTGAMLGSLAGGFLLLPLLGMERAFFVLGVAYGAVMLLTLVPLRTGLRAASPIALYPAIAAFVIAALAFPFGALREYVFPRVAAASMSGPHEVVLTKEGLTETILYVRRDKFGLPFFYKLMTNGHAMAATSTHAQHYMKLYVYLPVALHSRIDDALLISYGCGQTASALTATREIRRIDIVDISRDILDATEIVFPEGRSPLDDPRVHVHVEDGRFYLQTTDRRYDLITGEPPPPTAAGCVNLYSREYFRLIHDRLKPGGMTTYWLPQHALSEGGARAIVRAFTDVFEESSLWIGCGEDWMLLGVKDPGPTVSEERYVRQWQDPNLGPELRNLGFEFPEQLAAYFIADRATLQHLFAESPPVTDDFPHRISPPGEMRLESQYAALIEPEDARRRFLASRHIRRLFPPGVRERGAAFFDFRYELHDGQSVTKVGGPEHDGIAGALRLLRDSPFGTLVLWMLGSSVAEQQIVATLVQAGHSHPGLEVKLGDLALARRDFVAAVEHYAIASGAYPDQMPILQRHVLALCLADRVADAQAIVEERVVRARRAPGEGWEFARAFGVRVPG